MTVLAPRTGLAAPYRVAEDGWSEQRRNTCFTLDLLDPHRDLAILFPILITVTPFVIFLPPRSPIGLRGWRTGQSVLTERGGSDEGGGRYQRRRPMEGAATWEAGGTTVSSQRGAGRRPKVAAEGSDRDRRGKPRQQ